MNGNIGIKRTFYRTLIILFLTVVLSLSFPGTALAAPPTNFTMDHNDCYQGEACTIQLGATDPDGKAIVAWAFVGAAPAGMAVTNAGVLTWTPTQAQATTGAHNFIIRATDTDGESANSATTVNAWRAILTTHFRTRWWKTDVTDAYAQSISNYMENSWNVEVTNYTYHQPPNMAGNRIDVYIHTLAAGTLGSTSNATATDPPSIEMTTGMSDDNRKTTSAHEFYHCIQAFYDWNEAWIDEASARWMQDEVYDSVNTGYINGLKSANALLAKPETHMLNTYNYGGVVYPIALSEYKNAAFIKKMWERSVGAGTFIQGTVTELGGAAQWRTFWEEFAHMNYDVSEYSEGSTWGTRADISWNYPANGDWHYIFKNGEPYPPSPTLGVKIDGATYPMQEGTIPGLATFYLRYQVPDQVRAGNTKDTQLFLYFDGHNTPLWSVVAYGIFNDGSISSIKRQLVDPNNSNADRTGEVNIPVGGNGIADYKEVIIIIANTDTSNTNRAFKISGALVPVFQGLYAANADTGTTKTVKNLGPGSDANNEGPDEDKIYKNGDTIEAEVDLSDVIHRGGGTPIPRANRSLRTDFSAIDSNATPFLMAAGDALLPEGVTAQLEEVTRTDANASKYKIKYTISASNNHDGKRVENLPLKLELQDFSLQDDTYTNKDETFKITIDNEPPKVSRVIVTQGPKTIYDSQSGTSEWAKAGTIQVKVIFNESMQTDEVNGTDVDATVKFGLNAPFTAHTVTRSGGWSTTTKNNDTWTGTFTIPNDQGAQYDGLNTLSIKARDQAGNWLDASSRLLPDDETPDTSHKFKIDSTRPKTSTSTDYTGNPDCPTMVVDAKAIDELNGSTDPNKVSGLKKIVWTWNGASQTINNPGNPHTWRLGTIAPQQSATYSIRAEDKAGNIRNVGGGFSNNPPGCDKPDENLSVASPYSALLNLVPSRRVDPQVAILNNGFAMMTQGFIHQFNEPTTLVELDFDPAMVDDFPVLVIPSGGLYGVDTSPALRARLESYVINGGTIIAFDQQHGYEYAALPGSGVGGYGWVEDNSCYAASLYISEYHQILSGFSKASLTTRVDGFFTTYPDGALTPLPRTKNGFPGLVMYPYGDGWVVATTIYDDFGTYNRQTTTDAHILARDLLSWALDPAQLPEYDPGDAVSVPVTLTNTTDVTATSGILTLLDPTREIIDQETIVVNISPGGQQVVNFNTTAGNLLGIWWIDYELQNETGRILNPADLETVQEQTRGGRFVVSNPAPSAGPGKELGLSITAPSEHFMDGSVGRFTFHAYNFTDEEKEVEVRYGFPHHTWDTGDPSYGNFSDLSRILTVPAAALHFDRAANAFLLLPGEASFVHEAIMRTTDRLFGYLYYSGRQVDQNWFKIWEVPASVLVDILPDKATYTMGEAGSAMIMLNNLSQANYTVTVDIRVQDSQNIVFHQERQTATLGAQQAISLTSSFLVTTTANAGVALIEATAKDHNGAVVGSGSGTFEIPPSPLQFNVSLPASMTAGAAASVDVQAFNNSPVVTVTNANLAIVLLDPLGSVVVDLGDQTFDLSALKAITLTFPVVVPDPIFGDYRFRFTVIDAFGIRTWDETTASQVTLGVNFGRPAYRVREQLGAQVVLQDTGFFAEALTVTVSSNGVTRTQAVNVSAGTMVTVPFTATLPGNLAAGAHPLVVTATQSTGGSVSKKFNFSIAESQLQATLPGGTRRGGDTPEGILLAPQVDAGDPFTVTISNIGGADTTGDFLIEVTDRSGLTVYTNTGTTPSIMAVGSVPVVSILPVDIVSGLYWLEVKLTDNSTGRVGTYRLQLDVTGLSVEMRNYTNADTYLQIDPITATVIITNTDGDIVSGTLTVQVVGPTIPRAGQALRRISDPQEKTNDGPPSHPAPEGYVPSQLTTRRVVAGNDVLLLLDVLPWGYDAIQVVLNANGIGFDQMGSAGIPTVDLSSYHMVIIASDQTQTFYNTYDAYRAKFEAYITNGGILLFNAAAWGWGGGSLAGIPLPGGVNPALQYENYNTVLLPDHPLMVGVPDPFWGSYASHTSFSNLPPEAVTIAVAGNVPTGAPTLVEYPLGSGWVIAFGQTLEHGYVYGYDAGQILINSIPYAYDMELLSVLWEWTTPITLTQGSVTTIITPVMPLTATGKLYLRSWLDSAREQEVSRTDPYPFYVFPGLTFLTVETEKDFYRPVASMDVSGLALNARTVKYGVEATQAVTLTSNLTVTLDGQVVYTEGPFQLPPGGSHLYAFTTTAPITAGLSTLVAIVDDVTDTVSITDTVIIVVPQVDAAFDVPALVGQPPFTGTLSLDNIGVLPATVDYAVSSEAGIRSPYWSGQVTLDVGEAVLLQHAFQVLADTRFTVTLTGDVSQTLSSGVIFGEDAHATFTPPANTQPGMKSLEYEMLNVGILDTQFTTFVTVTQQIPAHRALFGLTNINTVVATDTIDVYLTAPGGMLTGTLSYDLEMGDYTLAYSNLFESGQIDFSVLGKDQIVVRSVNGQVYSSTLPFTSTLINVGYNHFTGTLRLEAFSADGDVRVHSQQNNDIPWASLELPFSVEPGGSLKKMVTIGTSTYNSVFPFHNYYENNRTQMLYLGNEIGYSGRITQLAIDINHFTADPSYRTMHNLTINLKQTDENHWDANFGYADMTGATTVFGPVDFILPGAVGWVEFPITPYMFNDSQNLIVEVIWGDNGDYTSDEYGVNATYTGNNTVLYGYADYETPPNYDGKTTLRPNLSLEIEPSPALRRIQAGTGESVITMTVNTAAALPGTQEAIFQAINGQGYAVYTEILSFAFDGPDYHVLSTPDVTATQVSVGHNVTMTFAIENRGDLAGEASLTFGLGDVTNETRKAHLVAGEDTQVDFVFYVNDDLPSGAYLAEYVLTGTHDIVGEQGNFVVTVQGIDITAETVTDQPYYLEGDPVHMTITVTNGITQATPDLFVEAGFAGYTITELIQLDPGEQVGLSFNFTATFVGDNKVAYGVYNVQSNRAVLLNTAYIYQAHPGIALYTDLEVYEPGDEVQVTVVTTATGNLQVEAPGFIGTIPLDGGRIALTDNTTFTFTLPTIMVNGTYAIYYTLLDCGCVGEGEQHTHNFDVHSTQVRVLEVTLDKDRYQVGEVVSATLLIASNEVITLTLESWIRYPDGSEGTYITQTVELVDNLNNQIVVTHIIVSSQLGSHSLVYRLYGPGNGLFGFRDILNGAETLYATGGELFDVGTAALLSLDTDQNEYTTRDQPVIASMQVYAAVDTEGTLALSLDDQSVWSQPVTLTMGSQVYSTTLIAGLDPGLRTLTATLTVGGAVSQRDSTFVYGTQIADLVVSDPWLLPAGGAVNRGMAANQMVFAQVTNQGQLASGATTLAAYDGDPDAGGTLIGISSVPGLIPGADTEVSINWNATGQGGDNDVHVWINPDATVPEFYTDNNRGESLLAVPRLDMATGIGQDAYAPGDSVDINTQLKNMQGALSLSLTLTTTVRPATFGAAVLFTDTRTLDLTSGEMRDLVLNWDSSDHELDDYQVDQVAVDEYTSVYETTNFFALDMADVACNASVDPAEVMSGETMVYQISFANATQVPAADVELTFTLPDGVQFSDVITPTALLDGPTQNGAVLTWSADILPANTSGTIGLAVSVDPTTQHTQILSATVEIGTTTAEDREDNNTAAAVNTLMQFADLALTKTDGQTVVDPGDTLTYTLTYTNYGLADAEGVMVIDTLPNQVNEASCVTDAGSCVVDGGVITFTLGNLAVSGKGSLQVMVTVSDTLPEGILYLTNMASIFALTPDDNAENNVVLDVNDIQPDGIEGGMIYLPLISSSAGQTTSGPTSAPKSDPSREDGGRLQLAFLSGLSAALFLVGHVFVRRQR